MKSPQFLAIIFVLLLALSSNAPLSLGNNARFDVESAWYVANNEWLANAKMFTGDANLTFPNEIPADAAWSGATVTDGNIVGTIIVLPLKEGTIIDSESFMFRIRLRFNAIIAAAFPTGSGRFQILQRDSMLYLFSPEIRERDIDALELDLTWNILKVQTHFGFIQFYPERYLLPTLPPEQDDESDFIKRVRKRSGDAYKDGQYTCTIDSTLIGLRVMGDEFKVIWEQRHVEGMEPANDMPSSPFLFGGFVNPDAPFSAAFRAPFGKESFKDWLSIPFGGRIGIRVTPPEERKGDRKYHFSASAMVASPSWLSTTIASHCSEEDGYHLTRDGNLIVFYPKQPEDRPAEDGVLSNEELDEMNEEIAHSTLALLANVRDSLLSMDWSHPLDFAVSGEDEIGYWALAYPPAESYIDWSLAVQLIHTVADSMQQARPDNPLDLDALFEFEIQEIPGTIAGLPGYRLRLRLSDEQRLAIVFTHEPGIIYAAVLSLTDGDVVTEEQFAAIQRRLEQKIEASRKSVAKGIAPPTTVLRANIDDTRFRADFETTVRGYRFTVYIAQESFGNVLALSQQFGVNPLQWFPFWQTQ